MTDKIQSSRNRTNSQTLFIQQASENIGKFISEASSANKMEVKWIQLIQNFDEIQLDKVLSIGNYSEEVWVEEFLMKFLGFHGKVMNKRDVAKMKFIDSVLSGCKECTILEQAKHIVFYFIKGKWKRVKKIVEFCEIAKINKKYETWKAWLGLFLKKKALERCEDLSVYSKIANAYAVLYSRGWGSFKSAVSLLKNSSLGDLEQVLYADFLLYTENSSNQETAIKILTSSLQSKYAKLAFYRLISHYLSYSMYSEASMLCIYVKSKHDGDIQELAEGLFVKIHGKLRKIKEKMQIHSLLGNYYFVRSVIKYCLPVSLEFVRESFMILEETLTAYEFYEHMFDIKFWQFLMYKQAKMEKKAVDIGKQALNYKHSSSLKASVIASYIKIIEKSEEDLKFFDFSIPFLPIPNVDSYLNSSLQVIVHLKKNAKKNPDLFDEILSFPLKYEGIVLNWCHFYRLNKFRESFYKITQTSSSDKCDPYHPLFYYKTFKKNFEYLKRSENLYVHIDLDTIWGELNKSYRGFTLADTFYMIQCKSYLRTDICKAVQKIKKARETKCHRLIEYFYLKYKIEVIRISYEFPSKKIGKLFSSINQVLTGDLDNKYKAKCIYFLSELYFWQHSYEKSYECYKQSQKLFSQLQSTYLQINKKTLTEQLIQEKLSCISHVT